MDHSLVIGIDGGGTICRGAALYRGRRVDLSVPGANVSVDFDGAVRAVRCLLTGLAEALDLPVEALAGASAFLGMAGVVDPAQAERLRASLPLRNAIVEEDRRASVADALGDGPGCVAVIGTGSFLGRQGQGGTRFLGGYGLALGDEASGAWLGREALAAALRAEEGMGTPSTLTRGLLARHGGRSGVIAFALSANPRSLAEHAPEVVAAASNGDGQAVALMRRGAAYLAKAATALGWQSPEPFCLSGGLGPRYAPYLRPDMRTALVAPQGSAPDGALALAARMVGDEPVR